MITNIFHNDIVKILTIFSISPGSRFLRKELQEKTKMNNVNLDNALNLLLNSQILIKKGKLLFLNLEESRNLISIISNDYKKLKELPLTIYFSIISLTFYLSKIKEVKLYLFGSYAKLIFKENSDIDLLIISDKLNKKEINLQIDKIESRYKTKIETHYFGESFFNNKKDSLVKEILRNGVRLI